jgi:hypothetical protein
LFFEEDNFTWNNKINLEWKVFHISLSEKGINQPERNMDALDGKGCEAF